MIATIETDLPISAEKAWSALVKRDTFLYITRGMLGFRGSESWPETFEEGTEIETRLVFFHLIPGWKHTLRIVMVDEEQLQLASEEEGGLIGRWNHVIRLKRISAERCHYVDEIDIRAGLLTPAVWAFAQVFYRYRQRRWRTLAARRLAR
jgi:hypothetical protein